MSMPEEEVKRGLLSRVGQGIVSFAAGVPASQIETIRSERDRAGSVAEIAANEVRLGEQDIAANDAAVLRQQETQRLIGIVQQGSGEQSRQAADRLFQLNPELANTLFKNMGATSSAQREDASRRASEILQTAPQDREAVILQQAEALRAEGRDPSDTLSLIGQSPEDQDRALNIVQSAALSTQQRLTAQRGAGTPAEQAAFEALIAEFTPEEQRKARRAKAGIAPRAVGSAAITTATQEGLTEQVAASEEIIRQRTKFAELTGASRAKAIDKGVESIQKIDVNIRNLDQAIAALDAGASTGAIESRFLPTIRASTVALEQIQAQLGLDVIQSVSFGALSEGELNLALATALPTGLEPAELREWIINRQAAQRKLRKYLSDQVQFLDQGGTVAGFLREEQRKQDAAGGDDGDDFDPTLLEFMTPEQRALFGQ